MKCKSPFFLFLLWFFVACGEKPTDPSSLAALGLSPASSHSAEPTEPNEFQIVSPREGEITTVYRLETTVSTESAGKFSVFRNGEKMEEWIATPSSTHTSRFFPENGDNTIGVERTGSDGSITKKEIHVYFGTKLTAGGAHSGFLKNGSVYTTGRNNFGQLGTGHSTGDGINDTITQLDSLPEISSIHFNQNSSMAVAKNGKVYAWGTNANGQLGIGNNNTDPTTPANAGPRQPPTEVPGITNAVMGAYGFDHALVLKADGTVVSFGLNNVGQLGNGATGLGANSISTSPVDVVGLTEVIQIVAGSQHSAALTASGEVYVWGRNQYGNLGNGSVETGTTVHSTPEKVPGLTGVIQIANGRDHILALKEDGTVFSWGLNASGQLGIGGTGSPAPTPTPTQVLNITNAVSVWAGGTQSFAVISDGSARGWGANGATANLGIGNTTTTKVYEPGAAVIGIDGLVHFGCGATHNFGLLRDGSVYGWGWNFKGSLGRPDLQNSWGAATPVHINIP
ncbi:chromosome condensation regulator [Leptospira gomenensis]|uniref:Chromosome condensation regulator n=1 Tax=Leptospira gomenensis TaxID=2484974 RepID=A0A5F1YSJ6_9LEPT|nr:RCC1 domain-containing protein [Leptospira gomenensis]TGK33216.1 chromosome condensation regulator [Leptospira gomenensis]TGK35551.1 chromosome condensation regulator [Leptospira gomenensis]TGK40875.1 chromosome condensation regulator [Leptospira gomenensis]TGK61165.1 chromosome condensation regulator [Leptospira gomenensis]